ncbi:nonspecific tight adherence protein D [Pasteurella canis]|uniref:Nonspecific tight adherence protein D n=1 Tax=Pasteurella canis TaxID=753 RepID=A0A379ET81_9PAST|nr:tetratricopeptide repeat protein [Pasteurella canis]MXN87884.1 tetratricopeptide repeat protein [Pasteurella canis]UDW84656.1 tetratricopeptide repeat protein [Pasteurella canis]UEC24123.1 tetratricopeptide repeat protein [Pasteurella canis]SUC09629.1 nonspecific tight adherence protein D [Pasteurella canis]GJH42869.1 tight adherance operon protein [Pasteurella canis]
MFSKVAKKASLCIFVLSIVGCSANNMQKNLSPESVTAKETLYESTQNYSALISLYRDVLKTKEDPAIRYKLAQTYYQRGDSNSSSLYLSPLLTDNSQIGTQAKTLQVKNLIQLQQFAEAISVANDLLAKSPNDGEIYNLRGIAYAQNGNLTQARNDITKAREFFINDNVAVNNLAMLSIINGDFNNAVSLLLPQYLNGIREPRLIHNLVFALVKNGNIDYAKDIIVKERLNTSPDDLINALKKTEQTSKGVRR